MIPGQPESDLARPVVVWASAEPVAVCVALAAAGLIDGGAVDMHGRGREADRIVRFANATLWLSHEAAPDAQRWGRIVEVLDARSAGGPWEAAELPAQGAHDGPSLTSSWALAAIGWATVDHQRAALELGLGDTNARAPDRLLGADVAAGAQRAGSVEPLRPELLLLEPATEGRLAASLARFGEGPIALYFVRTGAPGDNSPGDITSTTDPPATDLDRLLGSARGLGPYGPQRLVLGPVAGPHVILVDTARAGTIAA